MTKQTKSLSNSELQTLAENWLAHLFEKESSELQANEVERRIARMEGTDAPKRPDRNRFDTLADVVLDDLETLDGESDKSATEVYSRWKSQATEMARFGNFDPEELDAASRESLVREAMQTHWEVCRRLADFCVNPETRQAATCGLPSSTKPPSPAPAVAQSHAAPTLAVAWDLCVAHQSRKGMRSWMVDDASGRPQKNQHANWVRADLFELWGPERPISEITWDDMEELRNVLQTRYPVSRGTRKPYRDMTLRQLADGPEIPESERIKGTSKEVRFRLSREFLGFLRKHPRTRDFFDWDPDAVLKVASDPSSTYQPWSLEEVRIILESDRVHSRFLRHGQHFHPGGMFWLLAVLLYTGARQDEIMGLRPRDIELDRDHPVIRIQPHEHRPGIKTKKSERWVPVHQDLLSLGLSEWLEFRRRHMSKTKQHRVWPSRGTRGSNYWGDRFREDITKPLDLHVKGKKVMHSFRSTFDSVAANHMPTEMRRLITGHTSGGTDYQHYLRQMEHFVPNYAEHINQLDFGLDLERLKALWRASITGTGK